MKIETIFTQTFKPPYCQLYFIVKSPYDKQQMTGILNQIEAFEFHNSANIKMPLNIKTKLFICTTPQEVYNKDGYYIVFGEASKSRIQKAIQIMSNLENADMKIETLYIFMGKVDGLKLDGNQKANKSLKIPAPAPVPEYLNETTFKAGDQFQLLTYITTFQKMQYKIKVSGLQVTAKSQDKKVISDITEKAVNNYKKKITDKLKTEKDKLMVIEKLAHGII